jgi:hypothetical protein
MSNQTKSRISEEVTTAAANPKQALCTRDHLS